MKRRFIIELETEFKNIIDEDNDDGYADYIELRAGDKLIK